MPIFLIVAGAAILLLACSPSQVLTVTVEHLPQEQIQQIGERYEGRTIQTRLDGYAIWKDLETGREGHIFVRPPSDFSTVLKYHQILGHELDHLLRGNFHDPQP